MAKIDLPPLMKPLRDRGYVPKPVPRKEGTKSKTTLALRKIQPKLRFHVLKHHDHGQQPGTVMINPAIEVFGGVRLHNRAEARRIGLKRRPNAARPPMWRWPIERIAAETAAA